MTGSEKREKTLYDASLTAEFQKQAYKEQDENE